MHVGPSDYLTLDNLMVLELEAQLVASICGMYYQLIGVYQSQCFHPKVHTYKVVQPFSAASDIKSVTTSDQQFGHKIDNFRKIFDEYQSIRNFFQKQSDENLHEDDIEPKAADHYKS